MMIRRLGVMLVQLTSLAFALPASVAQASGWKLVFEDNFDGSSLDRDKWSTRFIYSGETLDRLNDELQHYRDNNNHIVQDGQLELVARQLGAKEFESGMIRSIQSFYFGYFESRVLLPKGKGVWPAFWLNPDYDRDGKLSWPPEIDIFEYAVNGKEDTENMVHSAASDAPNHTDIKYLYSDPNYDLRWRSYTYDSPLNEAWHVFGLVWAPDKISVFLDGRRIYTQAYKWISQDGTLAAPAHVLLNFAIGGQWAGRHGIDEANFPQALKADYVRVCQFEKGESGLKRCGASEFTPDPAEYGYNTSFDDLAKPVFRNAKLNLDGRTLIDGTSNVPVQPGTHLVIESRIDWPNNIGDRHLMLSLHNIISPDTLKASSYTLPFNGNDRSKPSSPIDYTIPSGIAPGEYYLSASLLAPPEVQRNSADSRRTPLRCDTDFDNRIKSFSCNIAKISVGKKQ
jgi:beta-glucanase (GH16 family)